MAVKSKVKNSWSKMNGEEMGDLMKAVGTALTGNLTFPTPPTSAANMTTAGNNLQTAYNNRKNGETGKTTYNNLLTASRQILVDEAKYVSDTANGDTNKIASSGFQYTKTTKVPAVIPGQASIKSVDSGGLKVHVVLNAVEAAENYIIVAAEGMDVSLPIFSDNQFKIAAMPQVLHIMPVATFSEEFTNLTKGVELFIRAYAHNSAGIGAASQPVSIIVQN